MNDPNMQRIPADIEKLLNEAPADFLRELEKDLPTTADMASSGTDFTRIIDFNSHKNASTAGQTYDAREAGFWELKKAITGDLPIIPSDITPEIPPDTRVNVASEPELPEKDIDFDISFRGYNRQQVESYIDELIKDYNRIRARCHELELKNDQLHESLFKIF